MTAPLLPTDTLREAFAQYEYQSEGPPAGWRPCLKLDAEQAAQIALHALAAHPATHTVSVACSDGEHHICSGCICGCHERAHPAAPCEHLWATKGVGSTTCVKCGEPSDGRQLHHPAASSESVETAERIVREWRESSISMSVESLCARIAERLSEIADAVAALEAEAARLREGYEELITHVARESHFVGISDTTTPHKRVSDMRRLIEGLRQQLAARDAADAGLREDKARLDWLDSLHDSWGCDTGVLSTMLKGHKRRDWPQGKASVRAAIDAARRSSIPTDEG